MMSTKPAHSDAIPNCLAEPEDEMVGLLGELISVPTENPAGRNYRACVNLLESCLRQRGFTCERVATEDLNDASGERAECAFASYGSGARALYFHGHYDVVPA